jgi:hypothetical protein
MSRAYRIRVRESLKKVLRAHDRVSTQLELLEILPADQMGQLLAEELESRGFQRQGKSLVRSKGGVTVTVDPETATVTVQAEASARIDLKEEREGWQYEGAGGARRQAEEALRESVQQELEKQARKQEAELQTEVTSKLEGLLVDLRQELDQVVNRVTGEALKRKAAQLGQIKELTEDPQTGSMTIVLEV